MMRRKKSEEITDIIGYVVFYGLFNFLKILPCAFYPASAKVMGNLFYVLTPSLKKKIKKNLDAAFENSISISQKVSLIKKILEKQAFFFTEWVLWAKLSKEKALKLIEFENFKIIENLSKSKKPVVLVSAHTGNFAVMLAALIYKGLPLKWIARDANNQYLARFMDRTRRKKGIFAISKENLSQAIGIATKWLRDGNILCLLIDQHSGKGTDVEFFGKNVGAPIGVAVFARKYNAAVCGVFISHKRRFRHKIIIEGPYEIIKTHDSEYDFQVNTQFFYRRIEHHVRQKPEDWFTWLHRRFR